MFCFDAAGLMANVDGTQHLRNASCHTRKRQSWAIGARLVEGFLKDGYSLVAAFLSVTRSLTATECLTLWTAAFELPGHQPGRAIGALRCTFRHELGEVGEPREPGTAFNQWSQLCQHW